MSTFSSRTYSRGTQDQASVRRIGSAWVSAIRRGLFLVGLLLLLTAIATVTAANRSPMLVDGPSPGDGADALTKSGWMSLQISQPASLLLLGFGLLCIAVTIRRKS